MPKAETGKHTPGPWKAHPVSSIVGSLVSYGDITKGENICSVVPQRDKSACEANARLIAAAPELLEALEKAEEIILEEFGVGGTVKGTVIDADYARIVEVIRKAKEGM